MRLIDADALIKKYGDWYVEEGTESGFIGTLKNLLATEPTVQPVATDTNVGDTISRQQAIRWVKTECNPYGKPTLEFESGKKVIEHLEQMPPAQPEPQWIPVSERLPEDTQYVLLTVRRLNNAYNSTPFISVGYIGWNQQHWWCAHDGDCEISKVEVLAWMPLPEAYKPNK